MAGVDLSIIEVGIFAESDAELSIAMSALGVLDVEGAGESRKSFIIAATAEGAIVEAISIFMAPGCEAT